MNFEIIDLKSFGPGLVRLVDKSSQIWKVRENKNFRVTNFNWIWNPIEIKKKKELVPYFDIFG